MRNLVKSTGALVLGLLVAAALAELLLRATQSADDHARRIPPADLAERIYFVDHPFLPYAGRPFAEYTVFGNDRGVEKQAVAKNNSLGYRTHELPAEKRAGEYTVVTLGGSTTWGALAPTNGQTWPALLEKKLRERYPERPVRVFNLGTNKATIVYSLTALGLVAAELQPDLVVVYHGFNDFGAATAEGYRADHAHFTQDLALDRRWLGLTDALPAILRKSYAAVFFATAVDRAVGVNRLSSYVDRGAEKDSRILDDDVATKAALARNWRHARTVDALARGYGGHALFSTFQYFDGEERNHRLVNDSLRELFERHELPYVDQDALIEDYDRSLQFDECHFTDEGRELIAENFFREIVARGWVGDRAELATDRRDRRP